MVYFGVFVGLLSVDYCFCVSVLLVVWVKFPEVDTVNSWVILGFVCCWKRVFAMTSVFSWQNSISLSPDSFHIPWPNLSVTPGVS